MASVTAPLTTIVALSATDLQTPGCAPFGGGTVAWYSHRSPSKTTENEDSLALIPLHDGNAILAIADGLGGHVNGAAASRAAIEALSAIPQQHVETEDLRSAILNAIESANATILQNNPGAATTLAVVELSGRQVRSYHAGDSAILVSGQRGKRKLMTLAHSPVGYAVESGMLDEDDAVHHAERHLVSNVVGSPEMSIEIGAGIRLAARDTLLIASDGLLDNLYLDEIINIIRTGPLERCAMTLLEQTRQRMLHEAGAEPHHPDDLSFILYRPA
ncbi:MAG: protein phosphatase 2C domain-containing protein [Gammaproteobacteria bacterium]